MLSQHTNMSIFLVIVFLCMMVAEQTVVVSNSDRKKSCYQHLPQFSEKQRAVAMTSIVIFIYGLISSCWVLKGSRDNLNTNGKYLFQCARSDKKNIEPKIDYYHFLSLEVSKRKLSSFSGTSSSQVLMYPVHLERYFKDLQSNNTENLMQYEWARYLSFQKIPMETPVMPSTLAAFGFYYVGPYDQVQCFSCQLVYGNWKLGDDPLDIHRRFSPECTFLYPNRSLNVPIHDSFTNDVDTNTAIGFIKTDNDGIISAQGGCTENQVSDFDSQTFNDNCQHPRYIELSVRLSSYAHWPFREDIQDPRDLAEAGFFYAGGFSDSVRCFCCGLELRNWDNGNGAWSEHAKWSANCLYLKQNKSLEFFQIHRNTDNDAASAAACAADKSASQINETYKEKHLLEGQNQRHAAHKNDVTRDSAETEQITKQVVEMGFEQNIVANAVRQYENTSESKPNLSPLLDTVLSMEKSHQREPSNNDSNLYPSTNETKARGGSQRKTHAGKVDSRQKHSITGFDHALSIDGVQRENRKLKNQLLCKICMDKNSCVVLLPCGHMIACESCSSALRKCAICQKKVRERMKVHTS